MNKYSITSFWVLACLVAGTLSLLHAAAAEELGQISNSAQVAILRNPGTPTVGAKSADVTLVEYFDYNCPFCKDCWQPMRMWRWYTRIGRF
jgi:protein-disulfide isomerase